MRVAKEKVDVLRDTVLTGQATKTKVIILHRNEMGNAFASSHARIIPTDADLATPVFEPCSRGRRPRALSL